MTVAVCYAPETSYALAQVVEIVGAEAHHLKNVLRLQSGSIVELFNGRGARAVARIVEGAYARGLDPGVINKVVLESVQGLFALCF